MTMIDPEIQIGDVVHDLTQNSKMQVVGKAADSVAEFRDREDFDLAEYKSHPLFRVSDDEPVFTCTYLKGEVATPGGTYDFPASRLARIPVEEANQDLDRIQDEIRLQFAVELLEGVWNDDRNEDVAYWALECLRAVDQELADVAEEMVRADRLTAEADD